MTVQLQKGASRTKRTRVRVCTYVCRKHSEGNAIGMCIHTWDVYTYIYTILYNTYSECTCAKEAAYLRIMSGGGMLSESFKGRGIRGKRRQEGGSRDLTQTIVVRTDGGTHGSEVQHIVDLFVDYSPCATPSRSRERSISAFLSSREPRSCVRGDWRAMQRISECVVLSPRRAFVTIN